MRRIATLEDLAYGCDTLDSTESSPSYKRDSPLNAPRGIHTQEKHSNFPIDQVDPKWRDTELISETTEPTGASIESFPEMNTSNELLLGSPVGSSATYSVPPTEKGNEHGTQYDKESTFATDQPPTGANDYEDDSFQRSYKGSLRTASMPSPKKELLGLRNQRSNILNSALSDAKLPNQHAPNATSNPRVSLNPFMDSSLRWSDLGSPVSQNWNNVKFNDLNNASESEKSANLSKRVSISKLIKSALDKSGIDFRQDINSNFSGGSNLLDLSTEGRNKRNNGDLPTIVLSEIAKNALSFARLLLLGDAKFTYSDSSIRSSRHPSANQSKKSRIEKIYLTKEKNSESIRVFLTMEAPNVDISAFSRNSTFDNSNSSAYGASIPNGNGKQPSNHMPTGPSFSFRSIPIFTPAQARKLSPYPVGYTQVQSTPVEGTSASSDKANVAQLPLKETLSLVIYRPPLPDLRMLSHRLGLSEQETKIVVKLFQELQQIATESTVLHVKETIELRENVEKEWQSIVKQLEERVSSCENSLRKAEKDINDRDLALESLTCELQDKNMELSSLEVELQKLKNELIHATNFGHESLRATQQNLSLIQEKNKSTAEALLISQKESQLALDRAVAAEEAIERYKLKLSTLEMENKTLFSTSTQATANLISETTSLKDQLANLFVENNRLRAENEELHEKLLKLHASDSIPLSLRDSFAVSSLRPSDFIQLSEQDVASDVSQSLRTSIDPVVPQTGMSALSEQHEVKQSSSAQIVNMISRDSAPLLTGRLVDVQNQLQTLLESVETIPNQEIPELITSISRAKHYLEAFEAKFVLSPLEKSPTVKKLPGPIFDPVPSFITGPLTRDSSLLIHSFTQEKSSIMDNVTIQSLPLSSPAFSSPAGFDQFADQTFRMEQMSVNDPKTHNGATNNQLLSEGNTTMPHTQVEYHSSEADSLQITNPHHFAASRATSKEHLRPSSMLDNSFLVEETDAKVNGTVQSDRFAFEKSDREHLFDWDKNSKSSDVEDHNTLQNKMQLVINQNAWRAIIDKYKALLEEERGKIADLSNKLRDKEQQYQLLDISQRSDISKLNEALATITEERDQIRSLKLQLENSVNLLQNELSEVQSSMQGYKIEKNSCQQKAQSLKKQIVACSASHLDEIGRLTTELGATHRLLNSYKDELEIERGRYAALKDNFELFRAEAEYAAEESKRRILDSAIDQTSEMRLKLELEQMEKSNASLKEKLQQQDRLISTFRDKVAILEEKVTDAQTKIFVYEKEKLEERSVAELHKAEMEACYSKLSAKDADFMAVSSDIVDLKEELTSLTRVREVLESRVTEIESQLASSITELTIVKKENGMQKAEIKILLDKHESLLQEKRDLLQSIESRDEELRSLTLELNLLKESYSSLYMAHPEQTARDGTHVTREVADGKESATNAKEVLSTEVHRLKGALDARDSILQMEQEKVAHLNRRVEELTRTEAHLFSLLEIERNTASMDRERYTCDMEQRDLVVSDLEQKCRKFSEKVSALEKEIGSLQSKEVENVAKLQECQLQVESLTRQKNNLEERLQEALDRASEKEILASEKTTVAMAHTTKVNTLTERLIKLTQSLRSLERKCMDLETEKEEYKLKLRIAETQTSVLNQGTRIGKFSKSQVNQSGTVPSGAIQIDDSSRPLEIMSDVRRRQSFDSSITMRKHSDDYFSRGETDTGELELKHLSGMAFVASPQESVAPASLNDAAGGYSFGIQRPTNRDHHLLRHRPVFVSSIDPLNTVKHNVNDLQHSISTAIEVNNAITALSMPPPALPAPPRQMSPLRSVRNPYQTEQPVISLPNLPSNSADANKTVSLNPASNLVQLSDRDNRPNNTMSTTMTFIPVGLTNANCNESSVTEDYSLSNSHTHRVNRALDFDELRVSKSLNPDRPRPSKSLLFSALPTRMHPNIPNNSYLGTSLAKPSSNSFPSIQNVIPAGPRSPRMSDVTDFLLSHK